MVGRSKLCSLQSRQSSLSVYARSVPGWVWSESTLYAHSIDANNINAYNSAALRLVFVRALTRSHVDHSITTCNEE